MNPPSCPRCRQPVSAGTSLCPYCAAPLNPAPATPGDGGGSYEKVGFGATGDVTVTHDASHKITNVATTSITDQSVHHHYGQGAAAAPAMPAEQRAARGITVPLTIGLAGIAGFGFWLAKTRSRGGDDPVPPPVHIQVNPVIQPVIQNNSPDRGRVQGGVNGAPGEARATAIPAITEATVGKVIRRQFLPLTDFRSGDLLTLRVRVDHACHLRVIYFPAKGDPVRMFPEQDGASDLVGTSELLVPDPAKLAAATPDCTAFKLVHEPGSGPPIREQLLVQVSDQPFNDDGSVREADCAWRLYPGQGLAEVRSRGVVRLQGASAAAEQARADHLVPERTLSITISP